MTDPLETLLVRSTIRGTLIDYLTETLNEAINDWLCGEIESAAWPVQDFPYMGQNTTRLMAKAALAVLNGIYDAEMELVREGMLDAKLALLPVPAKD